ncbi:probable serine/threonine-protein kinase DDB_G0282963 [Oppia nitens]|uniref:probable serine/threonine-protein kinase DDB_G0282963 n=1 Tax=Oppia nitens TaxID=1686743 RepID=UPI0023DA7D62|nr:probable serine/threonine-protein kinase DDB_G0282963 [Oppia nitens]
MIAKSLKKVNEVNLKKKKRKKKTKKPIIKSGRTSRSGTSSSATKSTKLTKIGTKGDSKESFKKSIKNKVLPKSKGLHFSESDKKVQKSNNNNNKSNKPSNIKKNIKEIVKKVKTKTNKKCHQLKDVVKRELRNNCKINSEIHELIVKDIKYNNNNNKTNKTINKLKQTSQPIVTNKDNDRHHIKKSPKVNHRPNLCSKLLASFNCINSSNNKNHCNSSQTNHTNSVSVNNKTREKQLKSSLRQNQLKNNIKSENKTTKQQKEKLPKKSPKNKEMKNKIKSNQIGNKTTKILDNKTKLKDKQKDKKMKKEKCKNNNKYKKNNKSINKINNKKISKSDEKVVKNTEFVGRSQRLASLNAIAKVRLLCENESERNDSNDSKYLPSIVSIKKDLFKDEKNKTNKHKKRENTCRAIVPVDNSRKQVAIKKRKAIDDSIEIIDTRSCKRMASLNASAIMTASYSPERYRRGKSIESNHSNGSVEMIHQTISQTVSRFEINPGVNGINGLHVNHVSQQNSVILKSQKHETIETMKQLKVSNKIKDRLLGIAKLERQEQRAQQKRLNKSQTIGITDQNVVSGTEFQATKVQVTKVTQINTSQGSKDKKSGHQIESILERDSSVVHKYQVQTKSTIEMQTTFNTTNGPSITNVKTITAPQMTTTGTATRMSVPINGAPTAQTFVPSLLSTPSLGPPTYFNFATTTPLLQVHNNQYQTMTSPSANINPMPIINLSEPFAAHYGSAFSVPHFATHSHPHPQQLAAFNYFNGGLYQPAGPLLQPFQDPCLIHKPIPFHPPVSQMNHLHTSPQFANSTLSGQNSQTFQNELTQAFHSSGQYFHPIPTPLRPSGAVFFQAMPQLSGSLPQNATTFTFLNPGVHYTHPTFTNNSQLSTNDTSNMANDMNYLNINMKDTSTPSATQTLTDDNFRQLSKSTGIQCSPQSSDKLENSCIQKQTCDSTNTSLRSSQSITTTSMASSGAQTCSNKRTNKLDHKTDKRKKSSMLLKHNSDPNSNNNNNNNNNQVSVRDNNTQTLLSEPEEQVSIITSVKSTNVSINNNNQLDGQQKNFKTICVQINTSLPSVSIPSVPSKLSMPSPSNRLMPLKRPIRKRYSHGWSWEGKPIDKYVYLNNEEQSYLRKCFPAIRHNEGDIIKVRDCVLLRSGPRKTDLPFVAKIAALWETPDGEMMMSLLWYYRPEHTDLEYYCNQPVSEIFASKHRDVNSVACIDDKCYVLTYNEFCRYKRLKFLKQSSLSTCLTSSTVPSMDDSYPRMDRLPPNRVFQELVFCCRKVYDYRQKRILKNPI